MGPGVRLQPVSRAPVIALFALLAVAAPLATAQVPIPLQEQIRIFSTLPEAQQQALMRELQAQLPPAQRQAILNMLQQGRVPQTAETGAEQVPLDFSLVQPELDLSELDMRLRAGDTLVIRFDVAEDVLVDVGLEEFQERLAKGNPYKLDNTGVLYLPGVPSMPLAGLNVTQATIRVSAEPSLAPFELTLTRLPLAPVGLEALERFGAGLFEGVPSTFAPATDIPVPVDYVLGPGDTVNIQLFGNQNNEFFLTVSREGVINFPQLGPVNVSGLSFTELRNMINERVAEQMIGVRASTTLGELRSIRVFVLGDVERPGSYTVSGLSTMTNALFASGGVTPIGSLRNVGLMRDGARVSTLDLYDLLLRGDTSGDARLQPGDVIFVPPIGASVAIDGEVRRPAIYELRGEQTIGAVVALAGGLNPNADRSTVKLQRIVPGRGMSVQDVNIATAGGGQALVQDGDVIRVQANLEQLESSVRLEGNVHLPGIYEWYPGMRISNLLPSSEAVRPNSDLNYVLVRREIRPNVNIDVLSVDLAAAWDARNTNADLELQPRDTVHVFNINVGRQHIVQPILEELETQALPTIASPIVRVGGRVRAPGDYPLEPGMRVSDLLRAGGGLSEAAYGIEAELTRYAVVDGQFRETQLLTIDLLALLSGQPDANVALAPYDYLNIKELPQWRDQLSVTVLGEVVFPGEYPIRQGETLRSVLERAGGLTDLAFPHGSIFTRVEIRERQRQELQTLATRVEADLASLSVSEPGAAGAISDGQALLRQLRESQPTGRLVIDLESVLAGGADIVLKGGDQLMVPDQQEEVSVLGEVQYATSHLFDPGLSRDDYVNRSGGLTQRADGKRMYVVRASGEVVANSAGRWFNRASSGDIEPGDTIVVPLDVDRPLARWSAITQIVYNLAIAAAAVNSF